MTTSGPRHPRPAAPSTRGLTRRGLLRSAGAAAGVTLAAPWVTTAEAQAGTLNVVLNQGLLARLWMDELHPRFEAETGARINTQQSVTGQMLAMLATQADNPPDLMQFSEAGVFRARDEGLLRPHTPANIPNLANVRPAFLLADSYSAGVVDAVHTLFHNPDMMPEAPTSWAALWDPENAGRIAIPPVGWNSGLRMITTAAQIATGNPMAEAQYDWQAGLEHLARLQENGVVVYTGAPQAIQMLQSGQVPLVPFYGVFINPLLNEGASILPANDLAEGTHGEIVGLNIPTNAPNLELAEAYINLSYDREFQEKIDSVLNTRSAHAEVHPSERTLELMGDPEAITYADWDFLSRHREEITDAWNEIFG